jgi:hypothetical protein
VLEENNFEESKKCDEDHLRGAEIIISHMKRVT